ncbi:MAG TPA: 3',5'-cyclic-nucleotide phosphodiesterase [Nitrospiraceae bacterium]|nr:3',5'-cyclic-nucleotide phosphodiesterase [Nitrospiraceae bacterium]
MKIRVLGCHGSDQMVTGSRGPLQCGTCSFLVNDTILLDAGTIGSRLYLEEQKRIKLVLLTHLHFDHIRDLPTLADNLVGQSDSPVVVAGIPEVLKGLDAHIFNGEVYPDFFRLPDDDHPVLSAKSLEPGRETVLCGLRVTPIPVNHVVPTVGFIIQDETAAILYSGDTFQTDELWDAASRLPKLKALIVETSFPNDELELARVSKHLTPALLAKELRKVGRPEVPVYVYHMKPRFRDLITEELRQVDRASSLSVLEEDQELLVT